ITRSWEEDATLKEVITKLQQGTAVGNKYVWVNQQLRMKGRLVVGSNAELRKEILTYFHNSLVGGHVGIQAKRQKCGLAFIWTLWKGYLSLKAKV
ncbi:hypothetical protein Tco_1222705, partial [Tanacetum coccineum]